MSDFVQVKAYAKINLLLHVLGIRADGYHQLATVMQTVGLADQLTLQRQPAGIEIICSDAALPCDRRNLVWQAFSVLQQHCDLQAGVRIVLTKHIPAAAGLAGGSADAAAVLRGANRLFDLGLSYQELQQLAAQIGSDVAFCLRGGTALAQGRGEIITQLPDLPPLWFVLVNPGFAVSTSLIYKRSDAHQVIAAAEAALRSGQRAAMLEAIEQKNIPAICSLINNDLQPVTFSLYPQLQQIAELLCSQQLLAVFMSGSGPTLVGVADNQEKVRAVQRLIKDQGMWAAAVPAVAAGIVLKD